MSQQVTQPKSVVRWDIFCRVIDNYGDIGVCWRLARQLAYEHGLNVRLFVDDFKIARAIIPSLQNDLPEQVCENVTLVNWSAVTHYGIAGDVAIETFACGLPETYMASIGSNIIWINLDYLSAEPWIADFHGRNSRFSDQLQMRHFYFPGFASDTGGLIREHDLTTQRDAFLNSTKDQTAFWRHLDVEPSGLMISIFFYDNAPLTALFKTIANGSQKATVLVPDNQFLQSCAAFFGKKMLKVGDKLQLNQLTLQVLPFLSQEKYDRLLWACDINFVRGEDSWIRAIWAAKPFIWQPYRQSENTNLIKLKAFINTFFATSSSVNHIISRFHLTWSIGEFSTEVWQNYLQDLALIHDQTKQECKRLTLQQDLATKLVEFCDNQRI